MVLLLPYYLEFGCTRRGFYAFASLWSVLSKVYKKCEKEENHNSCLIKHENRAAKVYTKDLFAWYVFQSCTATLADDYLLSYFK